MQAGGEALRRTPLHDEHLAAGARLVPFAGFEMPLQYSGLAEEHLAVRERCGVFDVSHMGLIEVGGREAEAFLQRALSNDLARLAPGGAQYSCLCSANGGILDDVFTYRLADGTFRIVSNAANHEADLRHLRELAEGFEAEVSDRAPGHAMLAVQGPGARALAGRLASAELPERFRTARLEVAGVPALACGTGYTGEDGVELLLAGEDAPRLWRALLEAGAVPCGLGARDTLRLEACYPLHGNDIGPDRDPIEAGLGWCCREATGFLGAEAVAAARAAGPSERLVPFAIPERGIPRQGNPIVAPGGERAGTVTSGSFSPSLELGIGMGYVRSDLANPGERVEIDVRGRLRAAEVRAKPLYSSR